jgi:hypothetical protein
MDLPVLIFIVMLVGIGLSILFQSPKKKEPSKAEKFEKALKEFLK